MYALKQPGAGTRGRVAGSREAHEDPRSASNRAALREATGIEDDATIETLGELGFTPETVPLLDLVPLVHVAWAEGGMSRRERILIQDLAQLRGIRHGSRAFRTLEEWLRHPLPDGHFERCLVAIEASLARKPERMRAEGVRRLMVNCTTIAAASRESVEARDGVSSREYDALEHIHQAIGG